MTPFRFLKLTKQTSDTYRVTEAKKAAFVSVDQGTEPTLGLGDGNLQASSAKSLDVLLYANGRLRIEHVAAYPAGFDPYGCSLVELVPPNSQLVLRQAAELCLSAGHSETVVVELKGDSAALAKPERYLLKLSPIETTSGPSLMLAGLLMESFAAELTNVERKRLKNLDELLETVPVALFFKDQNARFTWANRYLLESLEADSVGEVYGRDDFDFHDRSEAERYFADDQRVVETGEGFERQEEIQTRSTGQVEIVQTTKLPIRRSDGSVEGVMGFFTEVTEPKRVAKKLEQAEQRYTLASLASRDGVWEVDLAAGLIHLSSRAQKLLGEHGQPGGISWEGFGEAIGSSEFELLEAAAEAACSQPGVTVSHILEFEVQGSRRYVELVGSALVEGGEVVGLVGTAADVTDDRLREETLIFQANHDDLTGLKNRRALVRRIDQCIAEGIRSSLLYLDLDSFRTVNDSLGHGFGDDLLRAIARRLQTIVPSGSLVARIGADEFAVLIVDADADQAEHIASGIIDAIARPFVVSAAEIYTTTSIGIAHVRASSTSAEELVIDADIALYHAKDEGKARALVFDERMRRSADEELQLNTRLRRAVERREFELHYQPIFNSSTGCLVGVEALIRWNSPTGVQERPDIFLPYLEKTGLIMKVGAWVIDEGCRQLAAWREECSERQAEGREVAAPFYVAINLSRVQFEAGDLIDVVAGALDRYGLEPKDLILEVTETSVSRDYEVTAKVLARIQSLGIRVAIDDFGVGESSLSVLYEMPADIVKIDKSFIDRIAPGRDEPVILAAFQIARSLGLATVAEGVETELQRSWLAEQQCDSLQGYLLSKPLPADEIAQHWLNRSEGGSH